MTGQKGGFMEGTISRNDAYNTLTEYYHHTTEIQHKALREALERVPSAQPIRCKDCRWRDDYGHWLGCPVLNTDDDNFCSMAERRTGGN